MSENSKLLTNDVKSQGTKIRVLKLRIIKLQLLYSIKGLTVIKLIINKHTTWLSEHTFLSQELVSILFSNWSGIYLWMVLILFGTNSRPKQKTW